MTDPARASGFMGFAVSVPVFMSEAAAKDPVCKAVYADPPESMTNDVWVVPVSVFWVWSEAFE